MFSSRGMVNKVIRIFFLLLILFSSQVFGERWVYVVSNDMRTDYFYDSDSIKFDDGLIQYWELVNYVKPLKYGSTEIYSSKSRVLVNCSGGKYRFINTLDYSDKNTNGELVYMNVSNTGSWKTVMSGTVDDEMVNTVCSLQK
jgi:hypothetical protein